MSLLVLQGETLPSFRASAEKLYPPSKKKTPGA